MFFGVEQLCALRKRIPLALRRRNALALFVASSPPDVRAEAHPATCGLGTLVIILNALGVPPPPSMPPQKFWTEAIVSGLIDCVSPFSLRFFSFLISDPANSRALRARAHCAVQLPVKRPWPYIFKHGTDIDEVQASALASGAQCDLHHGMGDAPVYSYPLGSAEPFGAAETRFRNAVLASARAPAVGRDGSASPAYVAASFSRYALSQTGDGHFSPIGGYHTRTDSVLVLDAAKFKYPPYWVPLPRLWRAMQATDWATGRPRGYLIIRKSPAAR